MRPRAGLAALEARLGHVFARPELLTEALTHRSASDAGLCGNQRLEFLGDRVLGLIMAEALMQLDTHASEGQLAPRFNVLVCKPTCAEMARKLDLGACLRLGKSESATGGRWREAMLGDAMEALIAALYLDAGLERTRRFVLELWADPLATVRGIDARDAKTTLQEWAQARKLPLPTYTEVQRIGPDHAPEFEVEARLQTGAAALARAPSKRAAEQAAARALLARLGPDHG